MKLYLDANAFIEAVEGEAARPNLQSLLEAAENRTITVVTSELSLAETLTGPIKTLKRSDDPVAADLWVAYTGIFSDSSRIETRPIDKWVLLKAAELRAEREGLKLPDAIHLATAMISACDRFITGDQKLRNAAAACGLLPCSLDPAALGAVLVELGPL